MADIFTFQEKRGPIKGKVVAFIGDGAGNVANSWIFAAAKARFELRIAAPKAFQPSADLLRRAAGKVLVTEDVSAAATGADVLYTDVWVSMGKEAETEDRIRQMSGYQINAGTVTLARPGALVMHCLPAYRGKEIDAEDLRGQRPDHLRRGRESPPRPKGDHELAGRLAGQDFPVLRDERFAGAAFRSSRTECTLRLNCWLNHSLKALLCHCWRTLCAKVGSSAFMRFSSNGSLALT